MSEMNKVVWSFSLTEEEVASYDEGTKGVLLSELSDAVERVMIKYFHLNGGK